VWLFGKGPKVIFDNPLCLFIATLEKFTRLVA